MGRNRKFPGLQDKFETALKSLEGGTYQTDQLFSSIKGKAEINDEEFLDLQNNSGNYIFRAKLNHVLKSLGPKKGYELVKESEDISSSSEVEFREGLPANLETAQKEYDYLESFLHFIATVVLSKEFTGKVVSLKPKSTNQYWANPDMIMVRDNWSSTSDNNPIKMEIIRMVDSSPPYILTSIELKFDLKTDDRASILKALAETASNSGWANEALLVFMNPSENSELAFDEDAKNFARKNRISVLQIIIVNEGAHADGWTFELRRIQTAERRTDLNLSSFLNREKKNLLDAIQTAVKDYDENGSYREYEDKVNLAELIYNSFKNLGIQSGFKETERQLNNYLSKSEHEKIKVCLQNYLPSTIEFQLPYTDLVSQMKNDLRKSKSISTEKFEIVKGVLDMIHNKFT